jgi:hypothetical protein
VKLVLFDKMVFAIAKCHSVDEIKKFRIQTEKIEAAARMAEDREAIRKVTEIQVRAERRLGELLKETPKRSAKHSRGGGSKGSKRAPLPDAPRTLADYGISKKLSARAQRMAELPRQTFEDAVAIAGEVAGEVSATAVLRQGLRKPIGDADRAPVVIEEYRPKDEETHIYELFTALEILSSFPIAAEEIYMKVLSYQRHRVSNHLDAAVDFLNLLHANWRSA